jgi:hypothetical protein
MMYDQECHVPAYEYKFKRERLVTTFNEYLALPAFRLLHRRATAPTHNAAPARPPLANARTSSTETRRSNDTRRSPRSGNRHVRALTAGALEDDSDSDVESLTDDEPEDQESLSVHALSSACILCGGSHEPYCCPALTGNADAQRGIFASLRRRQANVRAVEAVPTQDADLLGLNSDFPAGGS